MNNLFTDFKPVSSDNWKAQINKDLKGIDANALCKTDEDGIVIQPFYHVDSSAENRLITIENSWRIVQALREDSNAFNSDALEALNSGSDSLFVKNFKGENYTQKFNQISLQHIAVYYELNSVVALKNIQHWGEGTVPCYDPLANFFSSEVFDFSEWNKARALAETKFSETLYVDASRLYEEGATPVVEIAHCLSQLCEQLNRLESGSPKVIWVAITCGEKIFHEIAKLRALRCLLDFVVKEFKLSCTIKLYVKTAANMLSVRDYSSNYLRSTYAAFAAVCGNCEALEVQVLDDSNKSFHRLGRNLQLVLKEESFLDKVSDPASGSYFVESLTNEIIEKAYQKFQSIEKGGGLIAQRLICLENLKVLKLQKIQHLSEGTEIMVGVNKFLSEQEVYSTANRVFRYADALSEMKGVKL